MIDADSGVNLPEILFNYYKLYTLFAITLCVKLKHLTI